MLSPGIYQYKTEFIVIPQSVTECVSYYNLYYDEKLDIYILNKQGTAQWTGNMTFNKIIKNLAPKVPSWLQQVEDNDWNFIPFLNMSVSVNNIITTLTNAKQTTMCDNFPTEKEGFNWKNEYRFKDYHTNKYYFTTGASSKPY